MPRAEVLEALDARLSSDAVAAVAVVVVDASGGLEVEWGAARTLGLHAGSILRGAVAYLAATMDAAAVDDGRSD